MPNEHAGHRSRLRERVRKEGLDNFQDHQVLEYALTFVIPYKDTNLIAHRLINRFGSFSGVLEADEEDIASVQGMGEVSAHFLANLAKIYGFYQKDKVKHITEIIGPQSSYNFVKGFFTNKSIEEMYVVCLSASNKIVAVEKISEGTDNEASVSIRKIMDKMSKSKVSNIIIAHNHPKGNSTPSEEDNKFTKALVTATCINGCHLIDHLIVGEEGFYSYREARALEEYKREISYLISGVKIAQPMAKYEVGK